MATHRNNLISQNLIKTFILIFQVTRNIIFLSHGSHKFFRDKKCYARHLSIFIRSAIFKQTSKPAHLWILVLSYYIKYVIRYVVLSWVFRTIVKLISVIPLYHLQILRKVCCQLNGKLSWEHFHVIQKVKTLTLDLFAYVI